MGSGRITKCPFFCRFRSEWERYAEVWCRLWTRQEAGDGEEASFFFGCFLGGLEGNECFDKGKLVDEWVQ